MSGRILETRRITARSIVVDKRMRALDPDKVEELARSIDKIGLQTPPHVWADKKGNFHLVTGAHRLAAVQMLHGPDAAIDVVKVKMPESTRRLWEIAENLHRAELTVLERSEHIAEWIRLTGEPGAAVEPDSKLSQVGTVSKGGRGKEGGVRAASRELGVSKTAAHRAVKIAAMPEAAKAAAREAGIDDNQAKLEAVAQAPDPVAEAKQITRKPARGPNNGFIPVITTDEKPARPWKPPVSKPETAYQRCLGSSRGRREAVPVIGRIGEIGDFPSCSRAPPCAMSTN